jgi:SAM-dependent methyltransferase
METSWANAEAYERFMGRWSRRLAPLLVEFAGVQDGDRVLDVGCGTGSLVSVLVGLLPRSEVVGIDPASTSIEYATRQLAGPWVRFEVADAQNLPYPDASFDQCLSLLVVNHVPDASRVVSEMRRVTRPGGRVAAAVWDYGDGMSMLRIFWDEVVALDPAAQRLHQGQMPLCRKGELAALWTKSGLQQVEETALVISMSFRSFEDYWSPFLAGVSVSGAYISNLPAVGQQRLRDRLREKLLGGKPDQPFTLQARAWAVRGTVGQRP